MNKNLKELIEYPKNRILSKEIFKNERADSTLFCMASGTNISDHTSKKQGFVYVLEGNGIFKLEDKEIKMESGAFIYIKEDSVHSLKAKENTTFLLILFNTK